MARSSAGLFAAVLTWSVACDAGSAIVLRIFGRRSNLGLCAAGAALAYGLLGATVEGLGALHLVRAPLVVAMLFIALALRWGAHFKRLRAAVSSRSALTNAWRHYDLTTKVSVWVSVFALVTGVVAAALPAVWWDPLAYHLPIVAAALKTGTFAFDPAMTQTAFPLLAEAAALPAFAIGGSAGAAMVTLGSGVVLATLCAALAARYDRRAGHLTFALFLCSPLWLWLAPSFYVDVPFALFVVSAIATPILSQETRCAPWLVAALCGALAGQAAAVKYPGFLDAAIAFGVLLWFRTGPRRSLIAAFGIAFAAFAVPAVIRDLIATGDPFYPLLSATGGASPAVKLFARRYLEMTRAWCGGGSSAADMLLLPWRMLVEPRMYCGDPGYGMRIGVVFFVLALGVWKKLAPLLGAAGLLLVLWFAESRQDRFILPALGLYAIVVALGVQLLRERLRQACAAALLLLSAAGVAMNWLPAGIREASNAVSPAFGYMSGRQSGDGYLASRLESYSTARWARDRLAPGARIIAIDDVRDYYFAGKAQWGNPFYQPVWRIDWQAPVATRYSSLLSAGYRYVTVNANRAYVRRTPTGVDWQVLKDDVRRGRLKLLFASDDVSLFEIVDSVKP